MLSRYILVLIVVLTLIGCSLKQQTEYIYRDVIIYPEVPYLSTVPRPHLNIISIAIDGDDRVCMDNEVVEQLYINQRNLMGVIRYYENQVVIYQDWYEYYQSLQEDTSDANNQ